MPRETAQRGEMMTAADRAKQFRAAFKVAEKAGFPGSRREFAAFVLRAPRLFANDLHRGAAAWHTEAERGHRSRSTANKAASR